VVPKIIAGARVVKKRKFLKAVDGKGRLVRD